MALFTLEELREVISVKVLGSQNTGQEKRRVNQISTASRATPPEVLLAALRGEGFEGHVFVPAVLASGAAGAIVHDQYRLPEGIVGSKATRGRAAPLLLGVREPLFAYQQLATHYRSRFDIPVVAVTRSNSKTTTQDTGASALARRRDVLKT